MRLGSPSSCRVNSFIQFQLQRSGRLDIEAARFHYVGGTVVANDATIDADWTRLTATLEVDGIDIQGLLDAGEIEQLTASGRLAGQIPLVATADDFAIRQGRLASMAPGVIAYNSPVGTGLSAAGEGGQLVAEALRNFHYDSLELTVDGRMPGETIALEAPRRYADR